MADLRVAVQTKVIEAVMAGTYPIVDYDDDTHLPIEPTESASPSGVVCNEVSSGLSNSPDYNSRGREYVLRDWRFECTIEFNKEVSMGGLLTEGLSPIRFTSEDGVLADIEFGDYSVEHPVRQGAQSGTKAVIGITVNTRR